MEQKLHKAKCLHQTFTVHFPQKSKSICELFIFWDIELYWSPHWNNLKRTCNTSDKLKYDSSVPSKTVPEPTFGFKHFIKSVSTCPSSSVRNRRSNLAT